MPESVEVDKFKLVLEDLHNLLLGQPNKLRREVGDLRENFTLCVFFFSTSLGARLLGLYFTARRRRGSHSNPGIRLLPKVFQLKLIPCLYDVYLRLSLLKVGLSI